MTSSKIAGPFRYGFGNSLYRQHDQRLLLFVDSGGYEKETVVHHSKQFGQNLYEVATTGKSRTIGVQSTTLDDGMHGLSSSVGICYELIYRADCSRTGLLRQSSLILASTMLLKPPDGLEDHDFGEIHGRRPRKPTKPSISLASQRRKSAKLSLIVWRVSLGLGTHS